MRIGKVLLLLFVLLAVRTAAAGDVFYPVYDMYIDTITVGPHEDGELYIANDPNEPHINEIMMYFDLSQYSGATIDEALLWVNKFYGCSGGNTDARVFHITEPWDETTWPNDQYIGHGSTTWGQRVLGVLGWNEIDVTYLVQSWLNGDFPNYGLVMRGYNGTHMSKLYSKEADSLYRPYLDIDGLTGIDDTKPLPAAFTVNAYPNPFNSRVVISYALETPGEVSLEIFNLLGQKIATPVQGTYQAGYHETIWNADGNPSGVYFYRLSAGENIATDKLLYLK